MDAAFLSLLGQRATDSNTGWVIAGAAAMALGYLYLRGRAKKKSDPLADPMRMNTAQNKHLERQMQSLVVELSEMAREMSAQIDTRAAKLTAIMEQADKRIAELKQLEAAAATQADPQVLPSESKAPEVRESRMSLVTDASPVVATINHDVLLAHAEIYQLADLGNSVADIARRVGKPSGEIELILSLRKGARRVAL